MPLIIAFINLSKVFNLVSSKGLFQLPMRIGCSPQLLNIISFHENIQGVVLYEGETPVLLPIQSGIKQECILALTLFGIFFSMLLSFSIQTVQRRCILTHIGKRFNLAWLKADTKVCTILIREMLM